jgi:hypothetical protein
MVQIYAAATRDVMDVPGTPVNRIVWLVETTHKAGMPFNKTGPGIPRAVLDGLVATLAEMRVRLVSSYEEVVRRGQVRHDGVVITLSPIRPEGRLVGVSAGVYYGPCPHTARSMWSASGMASGKS